MQLQDSTSHAASYISAGESGARGCGWAPAAAQLLVQEGSALLACAEATQQPEFSRDAFRLAYAFVLLLVLPCRRTRRSTPRLARSR